MRSKIAVRLKGGLGNQMFQVASADWLARKLKTSMYIFKDPNNKYMSTVFSKIPKIEQTKKPCYNITENEINFGQYDKFLNYIPRDYGWIELDIYGQWPELWAHDRDHVASLFQLPASTSFPNPGSWGVHFRGGDYVDNASIHYICRHDHYIWLKAIAAHKVLVSDDHLSASKENVETEGYFVGFDELDDLHYLMNCDNLFIGNSTFAWWAAYLGRAKQVYCPKTWLGPAHVAHKTFTLTMPGWTQIEN